MMVYLSAFVILGMSFMSIGVGILFFGRKDIGGECGTVPGHETNECESQKLGLCPMDDRDGYLKFATAASRLNKNSKKLGL